MVLCGSSAAVWCSGTRNAYRTWSSYATMQCRLVTSVPGVDKSADFILDVLVLMLAKKQLWQFLRPAEKKSLLMQRGATGEHEQWKNARKENLFVISVVVSTQNWCVCRTAGNHNKINRVRCRYFSCKHFSHAANSCLAAAAAAADGGCSPIWFWCECALAFFPLHICSGPSAALHLGFVTLFFAFALYLFHCWCCCFAVAARQQSLLPQAAAASVAVIRLNAADGLFPWRLCSLCRCHWICCNVLLLLL